MTNTSSENGLRPAANASNALWLRDELSDKWSVTSAFVPARYQEYVRILHPARSASGMLLRWAQIAGPSWGALSPTVQWRDIASSSIPPSASPSQGYLEPDCFNALVENLRRTTMGSQMCFYGVWTGYSWTGTTALPHGRLVQREHQSDMNSVSQIPGPRFEFRQNAGREYLLLQGPLVSAEEFNQALGDTDCSISPSFIWPEDKHWFVATDIDLDSTLIGGDINLTQAILASNQLEALPITIEDDLSI